MTLRAQQLSARLGLPSPTPEQAKVIEHPLSPVLVVAGAGSGKTATMSQRVLYLVAGGYVRPEQVLGLTFTKKATGELAGRVRSQLDQLIRAGLFDSSLDYAEPTIATYNSFAGMVVRDYGLQVGVDPDATVITQARAWQIMTDIVEAVTYPLPGDKPSSIVAAAIELDGHLSENMLDIPHAREDVADLRQTLDQLAGMRGLKTLLGPAASHLGILQDTLAVVEEYRQYKKEHGLLDFGDQIEIAGRIACTVPQAYRELHERFPAVLLDEFQDTSSAQIRFLAGLFAGNGVTAVGDPHQAIYGWRGGSAAALDTFHAQFNPDGVAQVEAGQARAQEATPVLPLSIAWRNDRRILAAANAVSEPLRCHVNEPGDAQVTHIPVEELQPRSTPDLADGNVALAYLQDSVQEAELVADFMEERWNPHASLAVLCRSRVQMEPIIQALDKRGIPCVVVGLGGMLSVPEVADIRSLITVAADPERGDRLMRLLTTLGLGAADIAQLMSIARTQVYHLDSPSEADEQYPMLSEAVDAVTRWSRTEPDKIHELGLSQQAMAIVIRLGIALERLRDSLTLPLPELVIMAEQSLGLDIELAARVGNPMGRQAVDAFRATAQSFSQSMDDPSVKDFLTWLDLAEQKEGGLDSPEIEPEPGAVQILTIHASKGLEWDAVSVIGLGEGLFPSYSATPREDLTVEAGGWMTSKEEFPHPLRADAEGLPPFEIAGLDPGSVDVRDVKEMVTQYKQAMGRHFVAEERRLAYVALTRARHDLLLTGSYFAKTAAKTRPMSRFLAELRRRQLVTPYGPGVMEHDPQATNPLANRSDAAWWPVDLDSDADKETCTPAQQAEYERYCARREAARVVTQALADLSPSLPSQKLLSDTTAQGGQSLRETARGLVPAVQDGGGVQDDRKSAQWVDDLALLLAERRIEEDGVHTVRMPRHLAATKLDDLRQDPQAFALNIRRPLPPKPQATARLGTVFHDAVAQALAQRAALFTLQDAGVNDELTSPDRQRIDTWLRVVEELPYLEGWLLEATEVERELTVGVTTVRCRIDSVFSRLNPDTDEREWLIVDWKTGRHRVPVDQLSLYVHAWAASCGVSTDRVRAAYVYVAQNGQVDEITAEQLMSLEHIEAILRCAQGPEPQELPA